MQGLAVSVHCFRLVAQTFNAFRDLDKRSERGYPQDFAVNHIADMMCREESLPNVGLKLLHAQRQAPLVGFNRQHDGFHAIALLQHFRRMLYPLGPAQVADVHQTVDAILDFDKRAEVGQVAHPAFDRHAHGIFIVQRIPGIRPPAAASRTKCAAPPGFTFSTTHST